MSKKKILLIEDTTTSIDLISAILSNANYDVFISINGELAINKTLVNMPDLILLDILMPGIDGFETCKRIKSNNEIKNIPIIFMSALAESFDKVKAFKIGAVDYITKPINNEELLARVNTHITLSHLQKKLIDSNIGLEHKVEERTKELKESEQKFRNLFSESPVSLWEEDLSEVVKLLNAKKKDGITDFIEFFNNNPEFVLECASKIKVLNINQVSLKMFKAPNIEYLINNLTKKFNKKSIETFKRVLVGISDGVNSFREETEYINFKGGVFSAIIQYSYIDSAKILLVSITDISQIKKTEKALQKSENTLRTIVVETSNKNGQEYFNALTQVLSKTLNVDYAFIGAPIEGDAEKIRTISVCNKNNILDNFEYKLEGTPCENVTNNKLCVYEKSVTNFFPDDDLLKQMKISGYIGAPLLSASKVVVGVLVCLYKKPIKNASFDETILQIFANGVSTELERLKTIENLHQKNIELTKSEQKLKKAQSIAKMGNWHFNLKDNKLDWSDEIYHIFDLKPHKYEATYRTFLNRIHPDDREMVNQAYQSSVKNKTKYNVNHRLLLKNDKIKYVTEKGITKYDNSGNPIFSVGTVQDITSQKLVEQKLIESKNIIEKSEKRFRRILDTFFDGVYICSSDYTIEFLSSSMEKRIGKNALGKKCYKALYNLNEKCKWCIFDKLTTEKNITYKFKSPIDNKYYLVKNMALSNGSKLTMFEDISKQEKAEKEIHKLITAVEQSANFVIITDPDGIIEYVNKKFTEVTGYLKKESIGKTPRILKSGKQSDEFYQQLWKKIKSKREWKGEMLNKRKNGELYWASVIITPILDANDELINFIGILEDITERKLHEKMMFNAIIETEETERKRFAEDLHDELGPYLSGIKLYVTQLTKEKLSLNQRLMFAKNLDEMIDESISITKLISNSLMPNLLTDFGYVKALESFINKINITQNIQIDFIKPKKILKINSIDEIVIYRIIIELINNTIKHANADKIEIKILNGKNLVIEYSDNGIGFNFQDIRDGKIGNGLINIFNRLKSINAEYKFNSLPDEGINFIFEFSN